MLGNAIVENVEMKRAYNHQSGEVWMFRDTFLPASDNLSRIELAFLFGRHLFLV